ncbi:transcription antitermination factor NusB [Corynebacterium uterequi]|uniref:Transcription antitermination protein NusB n=1 Tax=Corynebacterium uterequi TaxID=1072256 RepID=A0A0G3HH17_9CORY|nr:transcription antitermination factor NusB [Corynebacterium uterequi]AKK11198.1 NusB antitermination factor [Corynebacterium uterequi]
MSTSHKRDRRHGARYRARRRAVDIIFEAEVRDVDPVAIVDERIALSHDQESGVAPIAQYTRELVSGTAVKLDEIDAAIERFLSEQWTLERLPAVDRAILRVLGWEVMFNDDVDAPISVVDAVEIATQYSTDKAAPYIHAVLDDIAHAGSPDNPMNAVLDDTDDADDASESAEASLEAPAEAAPSDEAPRLD